MGTYAYILPTKSEKALLDGKVVELHRARYAYKPYLTRRDESDGAPKGFWARVGAMEKAWSRREPAQYVIVGAEAGAGEPIRSWPKNRVVMYDDHFPDAIGTLRANPDAGRGKPKWIIELA